MVDIVLENCPSSNKVGSIFGKCIAAKLAMWYYKTIWVQTAPVFIPNIFGFSVLHSPHPQFFHYSLVAFTFTFIQLQTTCRVEKLGLRPRLLPLWRPSSTFWMTRSLVWTSMSKHFRTGLLLRQRLATLATGTMGCWQASVVGKQC